MPRKATKPATPKAKPAPKAQPKPVEPVIPEPAKPAIEGRIPPKPTQHERRTAKLYQVEKDGRKIIRWMLPRNVEWWQGAGWAIIELEAPDGTTEEA